MRSACCLLFLGIVLYVKADYDDVGFEDDQVTRILLCSMVYNPHKFKCNMFPKKWVFFPESSTEISHNMKNIKFSVRSYYFFVFTGKYQLDCQWNITKPLYVNINFHTFEIIHSHQKPSSLKTFDVVDYIDCFGYPN